MLATLGKPPARFADFAVEAKYDGQQRARLEHGGGGHTSTGRTYDAVVYGPRVSSHCTA
jgi:hypothetical protein